MMMQNRYQRRRMYTRIAMGKNRAMDVVSGESSGVAGQVVIIYPMLLALQASQFVIGEPSKQDWSGYTLVPEAAAGWTLGRQDVKALGRCSWLLLHCSPGLAWWGKGSSSPHAAGPSSPSVCHR